MPGAAHLTAAATRRHLHASEACERKAPWSISPLQPASQHENRVWKVRCCSPPLQLAVCAIYRSAQYLQTNSAQYNL